MKSANNLCRDSSMGSLGMLLNDFFRDSSRNCSTDFPRNFSKNLFRNFLIYSSKNSFRNSSSHFSPDIPRGIRKEGFCKFTSEFLRQEFSREWVSSEKFFSRNFFSSSYRVSFLIHEGIPARISPNISPEITS